MSSTSEDEQLERLVRRVEPRARLVRARELAGGVSARVTALEATLEVERPGGRAMKLVVRRHGEADLRRNPRVAADEFRLLRLLQSAGVAAPAPVYLDESGEAFATPCVVVEYVEGEPGAAAYSSDPEGTLLHLAAHLAKIHAITGASVDLSFLPTQDAVVADQLSSRPAQLDESLEEGRIRDALEAEWPLPRRNKPVLLHGDFWPGNTLWRDGRLAAVVDWEDAAVGDPLGDFANARLEVLWAFGADAMRRFTDLYQSAMAIDYTDLPYWDLLAALRPTAKLAGWGLDPAVETAMRARHGWFVAQAFGALG